MKLIARVSVRAFAVSSVCGPSAICTVKPSSFSSSSGMSLQMKSIKPISSASRAVTAFATSIMASASSTACLPRGSTSGRMMALEISLALVSEVVSSSSPDPLIGLEAPMAVSGAMAEACPPMVINAPALPAMAPFGPTKTTTGTRLARIDSMISLVVNRSPPGVSSRMIRTSAPSRSATWMPRSMYSCMAGMIGPSASSTMASGCPPWALACPAKAPKRSKVKRRLRKRFISIL